MGSNHCSRLTRAVPCRQDDTGEPDRSGFRRTRSGVPFTPSAMGDPVLLDGRWYWRRDSNPHEPCLKQGASAGLEPAAYAIRPRQHGVQGWIRTTALFGTRSTGGRIRPLCHLHIGAPERTLTSNLWVRSPAPCTLGYGSMVLVRGFEPRLTRPSTWRLCLLG